MAGVLEVCDKVGEWLDSILPSIGECLEANNLEVSHAVREQLYSGLDGEGRELAPNYLSDPYFRARYKENAAYMARRYMEWKEDITPPEESEIGFSPRRPDTPNLFIDGTFHRSIKAGVSGDTLSIWTEGFKEGAAIEAKYGKQIFGLTEQSRAWLLSRFILPYLEKQKRFILS